MVILDNQGLRLISHEKGKFQLTILLRGRCSLEDPTKKQNSDSNGIPLGYESDLSRKITYVLGGRIKLIGYHEDVMFFVNQMKRSNIWLYSPGKTLPCEVKIRYHLDSVILFGFKEDIIAVLYCLQKLDALSQVQNVFVSQLLSERKRWLLKQLNTLIVTN